MGHAAKLNKDLKRGKKSPNDPCIECLELSSSSKIPFDPPVESGYKVLVNRTANNQLLLIGALLLRSAAVGL